MSGKEIEIRIGVDGKVRFEVKGVQGSECTSLTEVLMRGLGEVEEQQLTSEYTQDLPDYIESFETDE